MQSQNNVPYAAAILVVGSVAFLVLVAVCFRGSMHF
jgi:hypothetical protein